VKFLDAAAMKERIWTRHITTAICRQGIDIIPGQWEAHTPLAADATFWYFNLLDTALSLADYDTRTPLRLSDNHGRHTAGQHVVQTGVKHHVALAWPVPGQEYEMIVSSWHIRTAAY
jgi:hypothetical protein